MANVTPTYDPWVYQQAQQQCAQNEQARQQCAQNTVNTIATDSVNRAWSHHSENDKALTVIRRELAAILKDANSGHMPAMTPSAAIIIGRVCEALSKLDDLTNNRFVGEAIDPKSRRPRLTLGGRPISDA